MQRVRLPLEGLTVDEGLLFRIRTSAGITQSLVCQRAQISEQWYRSIENAGKPVHKGPRPRPSRPVVEDIAKALGCEVTDFCVPTVPTVHEEAA
jgi:transcriptional regulator with XRE-family HTH domain